MKKEVFAGVALALLLVGVIPQLGLGATPKGGEWTQFINNQQNTRYQPSSTINSSNVAGLHFGYFFPTTSSVTGTPIVANGNMYFADWGGNVYSVNLITGVQNWKVQPAYLFSSTASYANGMLYLAGATPPSATFMTKPVVVALSPTTGQTIWSTVLPTGMQQPFGSPIYNNGLLYIGVGGCVGEGTNSSCKGQMYALNANTGGIVWVFNTGGSDGGASIWGTVVIDPSLNSIYFGTGYNYLISTPETYPNATSLGTFGYSYSLLSLNAATGALNWQFYEYKNKEPAGDVDFGSTPNLFTVTKTINGTTKTYQAIGEPSKDGNYYILDRTTGKLLAKDNVWPAKSGGGMIGLAGFFYQGTGTSQTPMVYIPAYWGVNTTTGCCGILAALNPSTDQFLYKVGIPGGSFKIPGKLIGSVAVVPGVVFFGDDMGDLYGFSTSAPATQLWTAPFLIGGGINGGVTVAEGNLIVGASKCNPLCGKQTGQGIYVFNLRTNPTVTLTPSPPVVTFGLEGGGVTATLGGTSPTGTIKFTVYNSPTCSTSPLVTKTVTVSGNGAYSSGSFSPSSIGTYYWVAQYSGDSNNNPVTTTCNGAGSAETVTTIPQISSFSYNVFLNKPADPTSHSGTVTFNIVVKNYGTSQVTMGGTLSVTSQATVTCVGGNFFALTGTIAAGASKTYTLTCTYQGSAGQTINVMAAATFTDVNNVQGTVSESPANWQYSL